MSRPGAVQVSGTWETGFFSIESRWDLAIGESPTNLAGKLAVVGAISDRSVSGR